MAGEEEGAKKRMRVDTSYLNSFKIFPMDHFSKNFSPMIIGENGSICISPPSLDIITDAKTAKKGRRTKDKGQRTEDEGRSRGSVGTRVQGFQPQGLTKHARIRFREETQTRGSKKSA